MNNKTILPLIFGILLLIIILPNVSAFCRVEGYIMNYTGQLTPGNTSVYCQGLGETKIIASNTYYLALFGDLTDSCLVCSSLINSTAQNDTLGISGSNWTSSLGVSQIWLNITMHGDIVAPSLIIQSPVTNNYYTTTSVWYNVTVNEPASWCGYSLDLAPNVTMTNSSGNWNNLNNSMTEGSHSARFYCNDTAGNVGVGGPIVFYVDVTSPLATFGTYPVDTQIFGTSTVIFDGKCSDNIGLTSLQIWGNWSGGWNADYIEPTPTNNTWYNESIGSIPDGTWKWAVYCLDNAGWTDFTNTNRTFTIITAPLTINIISPTNTSYNTQSIWFNVTTTQTASWCGYSLDGTSNRSLTNSTGNWNNLNITMFEKQHNVIFYCNNSAGTMSSSSRVYFTVDVTPPVVIFGLNPINGSTDTDGVVTFNLLCTDNLAADNLVIYGNWSGWGAKSTNTTPVNNSYWNQDITLTNGIYLTGGYCNDSAGNSDWTPDNRTFSVVIPVVGPGGGGGGGSSEVTAPNKTVVDVCGKCSAFIQTYSFWSFSVVDLDNFYSIEFNNTNVTKAEFQDTLTNFNTKCYQLCWPIRIPLVGKYLEIYGKKIIKENACSGAWIIIIIILVIIAYFGYRYYKKNKHKFR